MGCAVCSAADRHVFVACYYGSKANTNCDGCANDLRMTGSLWGMVILLLIAAAVFSAVWLSIIKAWPETVIKFTLGLGVALAFINAIILFAIGEIVGAVFMLIFGLLNLLWAYLVRNRIPFSATILQICTETIRRFPAMVYVAYVSILVQGIWLLIWLVAASSVLNDLNNQNTNGSGQGAAVFFLLLSFYWTTQVIKNVVHVTVSGSFASWYFLYPNAMPQNPTIGALKRATWSSLGSVCLGSLIVAILKTIRAVIQMGRRSRNSFARACADCLLSCLERAVAFFNVYAFTHVAVYGSTYCEAANQTWALIKARGWTLLINDQLISPVLMLGAILVGLFTAGIAMLVAYAAINAQYWGFWGFAGFLVGFAIALCAMEVVESCVASLFVCFAEDPEALSRTKPNEYNRLNQAFHGRMVELRAANPEDVAANPEAANR